LIPRRKLVIALGAAALAAPLASFAQKQAKVWRIGYLAMRSRSTPADPEVYYDAFTQGMHELGYVEGKNLVIEWRFADGKVERLPSLAAELVQMKLDVIVTHATPATEALRRATSTIPIVMHGIDPVGSGFAASLARPGGNITGQSYIQSAVSSKQIELLKFMLPKLSRVAILANPGNPAHPALLKDARTAAQQTGLELVQVDARNLEEVERGFAMITRERAEAILVVADGLFIGQRRRIAELAIKHRIPSIFSYREGVQAGGLMSYGQDLIHLYRRAATYVDKILRGAKPSELPIEQPTIFHLAINRKTAKALGLSIPQELLLRADEVIE
jgi:putative ABC transport system substrate-binding protein